MEKYWTFRAFKAQGANTADAWLGSLPPKYEEDFRALISHMAITKTWKGDYFKALRGYRNLYEIKLAKSVQYRLLGCYGKRGEFIFLIGTSKVSNDGRVIWTPRNALTIAIQRRELALSDEGNTDEYE
jgi:hypothetical protein